jgi:3-hydroxyisobutyrate dehydrogenase-like beta-hydroxyacid dehydrogenase|tara:strand:- start:426 stop:665 length:240 start_codon:yes stop_codon:yes gene_type:complete
MKLTKQRLKEIIKEEFQQQLAEGPAEAAALEELDRIIASLTDSEFVYSVTRGDPYAAERNIKEIVVHLKRIKAQLSGPS